RQSAGTLRQRASDGSAGFSLSAWSSGALHIFARVFQGARRRNPQALSIQAGARGDDAGAETVQSRKEFIYIDGGSVLPGARCRTHAARAQPAGLEARHAPQTAASQLLHGTARFLRRLPRAERAARTGRGATIEA